MFEFFKRQWFFYAYTILILPSYILPWVGSNSMMANIFSDQARWGFSVHALSLGLAVGISFLRGRQINKPQLGSIALAALACDLIPIINLIPLLPSLFHGLTIMLGTNTKIGINPQRLN
jgi:hypothetical protein